LIVPEIEAALTAPANSMEATVKLSVIFIIGEGELDFRLEKSSKGHAKSKLQGVSSLVISKLERYLFCSRLELNFSFNASVKKHDKNEGSPYAPERISRCPRASTSQCCHFPDLFSVLPPRHLGHQRPRQTLQTVLLPSPPISWKSQVCS
jgi:hypothetical protein